MGTLARAIEAARTALQQADGGCINVLVNGNHALAVEAAAWASTFRATGASSPDLTLRVWFIALGDKANAWNQYVHQILPGTLFPGSTHFFIDGYVELRADALALIAGALAEAPAALAATGVPSDGRGAAALRAQLLREGGIHGNLFALRCTTMSMLRERGFRLPLGLYRTDSILGAALCFRLDPATHSWNRHCILVHPHASWHVQLRRWWLPIELLGQAKRVLRQAQGRLEICAVREHLAIARRSPQTLPFTAREMVDGWIGSHSRQAARMLRWRPLTRHALRRLSEPRDWSAAHHPPQLLSEGRPFIAR